MRFPEVPGTYLIAPLSFTPDKGILYLYSSQAMSQETCGNPLSSPTSHKTRLQEKDELASLNDRFLAYKEKLRTDTTNQLKFEVEQATAQVGKEVKELYENELADARRLIDETAKEKARQQLKASKNASRVNELEAE